MKYRKKPIEVEAFQMTGKDRWHDMSCWPAWLRENKSLKRIISNSNQAWIEIDGLCHTRYWGFWIILELGELSLCKPDIFEQTYEAVS